MAELVSSLAGVIVGGAIIIVRDWFASKSERRREALYGAIRLICILEEYADKCIDVYGDDGTANGELAGRTEDGQRIRIAQVKSPPPPEYPDDISWRSIEESLMYRALALPNKARNTDRYVLASAENAFQPDYEEFFEPRQEGYARLGLEALMLSDDLRNHYGISVRSRAELNANWDPKEYLRDRLSQRSR